MGKLSEAKPWATEQKSRKQKEKSKLRQERSEQRAIRALDNNVSARQALAAKLANLQTKVGPVGKSGPVHLQKKVAALAKLEKLSRTRQRTKAEIISHEANKSELTRELEKLQKDEADINEEGTSDLELVDGPNVEANESVTSKIRAGILSIEALKAERRERANATHWMVKRLGGDKVRKNLDSTEFGMDDDDASDGSSEADATDTQSHRALPDHPVDDDEEFVALEGFDLPPPPPLPTFSEPIMPKPLKQHPVQPPPPPPSRPEKTAIPPTSQGPVISCSPTTCAQPPPKQVTTMFVPTSVRLKGNVNEIVKTKLGMENPSSDKEFKQFLRELNP